MPWVIGKSTRGTPQPDFGKKKQKPRRHRRRSEKAWPEAKSPIGEPLYCYRYTLSFDEDKRLKDWKREECVPRPTEEGTESQ